MSQATSRLTWVAFRGTLVKLFVQVQRQKWEVKKTEEIRKATIRGLEPEVNQLIVRHTAELRRRDQQHQVGSISHEILLFFIFPPHMLVLILTQEEVLRLQRELKVANDAEVSFVVTCQICAGSASTIPLWNCRFEERRPKCGKSWPECMLRTRSVCSIR